MTTSKSFSNTVETVTDIVKSVSLLVQKKSFLPDEDLFASGALDSVVLVGLLSELESRFHISIPPTEFNPENFSTIRGMSRLVERVQNASADS